RFRTLRAVGLGLAALTATHDAPANDWPPARGADMSNPAHWPNDPGYPTLWPYFSWLPAKAPGSASYLDADTKLGASGIHLDVAWGYTIGRSDVKIAVVDSGIEWDEPELVNKAWLNADELVGMNKPLSASGSPCGGIGPLAGYDCDA